MHGTIVVRNKPVIFLMVTIIITFGNCTFGNFAFGHIAYGDSTTAQMIKDVSADEAFSLIEKRSGDPHFIILDVRTDGEYTEGHIEGALNIDYKSSDFSKRLEELDKDDTYLLYCASGGRSAKALEIMRELGFMNIYHLYKGFMSWQDAGLPVSVGK
jgi:rhodanese-related sulfurtransferase